MVMLYVDRFVHLRRFETMSLHVVFQRLKVSSYLDPQAKLKLLVEINTVADAAAFDKHVQDRSL